MFCSDEIWYFCINIKLKLLDNEQIQAITNILDERDEGNLTLTELNKSNDKQYVY